MRIEGDRLARIHSQILNAPTRCITDPRAILSRIPADKRISFAGDTVGIGQRERHTVGAIKHAVSDAVDLVFDRLPNRGQHRNGLRNAYARGVGILAVAPTSKRIADRRGQTLFCGGSEALAVFHNDIYTALAVKFFTSEVKGNDFKCVSAE